MAGGSKPRLDTWERGRCWRRSPLEQLLRHEGCEEDVLKAHEQRRFRLRDQDDLAGIRFRQPLERLPIRGESQPVRAALLAHPDDFSDLPCELRTIGKYSELGVGTVRS